MSLAAHSILGLVAFAAGPQDTETPPPPSRVERMERVRERWQELSPPERRRLEENFRRWQDMPPERRAQMRRRLERMEGLRRRVLEWLSQEERRHLLELGEGRREAEIDRRVHEVLRETLRILPEDVRRRLLQRVEDLPPGERGPRLARVLDREVKERVDRFLDTAVERGAFDRERAERLRERIGSLPPPERFRALRRLLLDHADGLGLPPAWRERLRETEHPHAVLRILRALRDEQEGAGKSGPF